MSTAVSSLLRSAIPSANRRLRVLTYCVHERYQSCFTNLPVDFYCLRGANLKDWDFRYAPLPKNHFLVTVQEPSYRGVMSVLPALDFDIVLSQNKYAHFELSREIANHLHLPLISLEHCLPPNNIHPQMLVHLREMKGHINLFITDYSRKQWGWTDDNSNVIPHGVDTEMFCPTDGPRRDVALSVVNKWEERDAWCGYRLWIDAMKVRRVGTQWHSLYPTQVIGDNPGLSTPASSPEALAEIYRTAKIFLNTSLVSPIPTSLCEAMASGCAVVSTPTAAIPEVIQHGVNGLLGNSAEELRECVGELFSNPELCVKLGDAARQTILKDFSLSAFEEKWLSIFQQAAVLPIRGV